DGVIGISHWNLVYKHVEFQSCGVEGEEEPFSSMCLTIRLVKEKKIVVGKILSNYVRDFQCTKNYYDLLVTGQLVFAFSSEEKLMENQSYPYLMQMSISHHPFMFRKMCINPTGGERDRMTANHESYLLMANTQNDMEDWVKSIRRVIWGPFGGGEQILLIEKQKVDGAIHPFPPAVRAVSSCVQMGKC
ncbi:hypothetical protein STEG23_003206, partial [Scotinomys teguina]